jgi:hypothetical protein
MALGLVAVPAIAAIELGTPQAAGATAAAWMRAHG